MPTPDDAPTVCPHCHEAVPEGARLCPNCGADVPPPLPSLGDAPDATPLFWTGSHGGDTVAGTLIGIFAPPVAAVAWAWLLMYIFSSLFPSDYLGLIIALWGGIPCCLVALFFLARRMARSRYHIAQVARKYFLGWVIVVTLIMLGVLATCFINSR